MKNNAVICPPCGENVGLPTKRGAYKGFTLIELLVVVLIIGILAAVAVPQYKKAVEISRITAWLPQVKSIEKAQEIYYLEHGKYTSSLEELGVSIPWTRKEGNYAYELDDSHYLLVAGGNSNMHLNYCPGHNHSWWPTCATEVKVRLWFYYQHHPSDPGKKQCEGNSKLCASLRKYL